MGVGLSSVLLRGCRWGQICSPTDIFAETQSLALERDREPEQAVSVRLRPSNRLLLHLPELLLATVVALVFLFLFSEY
jgi:hypothetical protein